MEPLSRFLRLSVPIALALVPGCNRPETTRACSVVRVGPTLRYTPGSAPSLIAPGLVSKRVRDTALQHLQARFGSHAREFLLETSLALGPSGMVELHYSVPATNAGIDSFTVAMVVASNGGLVSPPELPPSLLSDDGLAIVSAGEAIRVAAPYLKSARTHCRLEVSAETVRWVIGSSTEPDRRGCQSFSWVLIDAINGRILSTESGANAGCPNAFPDSTKSTSSGGRLQ